MNARLLLRNAAGRIPQPVGAALARVPYGWRLGREYGRARALALDEAARDDGEVRARTFARVRRIAEFAWNNVPFHRRFWSERGFDIASLRSFDDIDRIPVATKDDLRAEPLAGRSAPAPGRMLVNTGGTSGQPLEFFLDRDAFAREWAHMHLIWERLGYRTTDAKLTFRGKNLGADPIRYNAVHNEYLVNAYAPMERQLAAVAEVAARIRFLHGYPSSIGEFARRAAAERPDIVERLRAGLKGVLFGSEFPAPIHRKPVEDIFGAPTLSWYGHSEMAVLAFEVEPFEYVPFSTYGHCEALPAGNGEWRLVGTSYGNVASPFVRYDTGDLVAPRVENGLVKSFRVASGRTGDFVVDAAGTRVSLTALVFGRHHGMFGRMQSIQVRQKAPGEATFVVVPLPGERPSREQLAAGFDLSNVALAIDFEVRDAPWRTPAGKAPLKIPADAR